MAEFKDFVAKAKDIAEGISKKTEELAELARLKTKIIDLESDIERKYRQLGKAYYTFSMELDNDTDIETVITEIKDKTDEAEALKTHYNIKRGIKICENCGSKIQGGGEFCSKCGEKA